MTFFLLRPRAVLGLLLVLLGAAAACTSTKEPDHVHVLTWQGAVNPVMERYIDRGIDAAERARARAVVIQLDTPGGLDSAMRGIIKRIQASQVPVIVYVSPAGGRAASAGTFITMAGHVAAMAPGTTIGAATPINASGEDIEGALGRKVINDAVAYIRSIAAQRNRNVDWAEDAVRDARVATEVEAVELNVIDFGAQNLTDLLAQAHGLEVTVQTETGAAATATLRTANAPVLTNNPTFFERVLYQLANPNIAFLLISLGGLAIVAEIYFQTGVTGIFGVIALILAYFSLGTLPTNWAGVGLISFGFVLLAAEIFFAGAGFGVLGIGGVISLALGGLNPHQRQRGQRSGIALAGFRPRCLHRLRPHALARLDRADAAPAVAYRPRVTRWRQRNDAVTPRPARRRLVGGRALGRDGRRPADRGRYAGHRDGVRGPAPDRAS